MIVKNLLVAASFLILLLQLPVLALNAQQIEFAPPLPLKILSSYVSSECTLSQAPKDHNILLATTLTAIPNAPSSTYHTQVWQSRNGGQSWSDLNFPPLSKAADPWGIVWENGTALVADISEANRFHLHTTYFNQRTQQWEAPTSFGYGFDHCMLIRGHAAESVYLIATQKYRNDQGQFRNRILIGYSTDGGQNFPHRYFHDLIHGLEFNAKHPIVHPDGTLLIPISIRGYFFQEQQAPISFQQTHTWLYPFHNHGAQQGTPSYITHLSGRKHHWLISSSQDPEHLFFAFTDIKQQRLGLVQSQDTGASWAAPSWIYQDSSNIKSVDLSAMAINSKEDLAISWAKRMGNGCYQRMLSVLSIDNNNFISQEIGSGNCPDDSNGWVKSAWPQGGDYCGLQSNSDNSFNLLYSYPKQGRFTLHFTQIRITR